MKSPFFNVSSLLFLEANSGHKEKEISSEIRNLKSKVSSIRDVILKEVRSLTVNF